jgi:predicted molibdopterin-dependent oxidoreductase YjgC
VTVRYQGREIEAFDGEPIAAALLAAGVSVFRTTPKRGEPRRLFCGIGRCTDCVMVVDGMPNVRTCVTPVRDGMEVEVLEGRGAWTRRRAAGAPRAVPAAAKAAVPAAASERDAHARVEA